MKLCVSQHHFVAHINTQSRAYKISINGIPFKLNIFFLFAKAATFNMYVTHSIFCLCLFFMFILFVYLYLPRIASNSAHRLNSNRKKTAASKLVSWYSGSSKPKAFLTKQRVCLFCEPFESTTLNIVPWFIAVVCWWYCKYSFYLIIKRNRF